MKILNSIKNSRKGFTLVEILVVISIIGVLASGSIVLINPIAQLQKARDTQRKSDLRQIQSALEMYRADIGGYPANLPSCGSALVQGSVTYMAKVPCDPKGGSYAYTLSGSAYTLIGCLENLTDTQADSPFVGCTTSGSSGHTMTVTNP